MCRQLVLITSTLATAIVPFTLVVSGCSSDTNIDPSPSASNSSGSDAPSEPLEGAIVVSAAASLTEAFTAIKADFVKANPGTDVSINFGSSGQLSAQIGQGAPADVAAFADITPMTALSDAGLLAGPPEAFAKNQLVIVTKPGNPAAIAKLSDLADAGTVALCVETAPCGKFADQILDKAGVTLPAGRVTRGTDVKSTLTAVTEGDAVAGIVYVTDAASVSDQVDIVDIAVAANVVVSYPIAVVRATKNDQLADAFKAYVLGDEGQAVLKEAGFLSP